MRHEIVKDVTSRKRTAEVKYTESYNEVFDSQNYDMIYLINISIEDGSFPFKVSFEKNLPQTLTPFSSLVKFDNNARHEQSSSLLVNFIPSLMTKIVCRDRRDASHRLFYKILCMILNTNIFLNVKHNDSCDNKY